MKENKIAININYKGTCYTSNYHECTKENEEKFLQICNNAASGKSECIYISSDNKVFYFPRKILDKSIICVIYKNE